MDKQINKILIPTDYSPNATRAANFGFGLAQKLGSDVVLFHSYHFPLTTSEDMVYVAKMKDGEEEKLQEAANTFSAKFPGVNIKTVVEYGSAVDLIESLTAKDNIDLIVMGTKGETNAFDALLGSVASNVINNVMCSTLIIPEETREFKMEEIMLATDFHETKDMDFYGPLLHILDRTDASVSIVNVKPALDLAEVPSKTEIETDNMFGKYKHSHHFIEAENVEEALFDFANVHDSDLIVILTKHYSLWQRLWHKSMAKQMALHSNKPLFIIHEDA